MEFYYISYYFHNLGKNRSLDCDYSCVNLLAFIERLVATVNFAVPTLGSSFGTITTCLMASGWGFKIKRWTFGPAGAQGQLPTVADRTTITVHAAGL